MGSQIWTAERVPLSLLLESFSPEERHPSEEVPIKRGSRASDAPVDAETTDQKLWEEFIADSDSVSGIAGSNAETQEKLEEVKIKHEETEEIPWRRMSSGSSGQTNAVEASQQGNIGDSANHRERTVAQDGPLKGSVGDHAKEQGDRRDTTVDPSLGGRQS